MALKGNISVSVAALSIADHFLDGIWSCLVLCFFPCSFKIVDAIRVKCDNNVYD